MLIPNITLSKSGIDDWNIRNLDIVKIFIPKFQPTTLQRWLKSPGVDKSGIEKPGVESYAVEMPRL